MSRPELVRPNTTEGPADRPRTTNFSRPIAPARSQSISHDLRDPPSFELDPDPSPPKAQKLRPEPEPKTRYLPHIRISDDEDRENALYRPHLRIEDDDEEDEAEDSLDESMGTTEPADDSYESNPPTSSTERTSNTDSSVNSSTNSSTVLHTRVSAASKPAAHLSPSKSRPAAFASNSFNSISSTSSAAPKPLNIRPPISRYARARQPTLETIPSASPRDSLAAAIPSHSPEPVADPAPSPTIPSRRHPPIESLLPLDANDTSDPESAEPPSIPTRRRPRIVKRVSFEQHSEHQSPAITNPSYPSQSPFSLSPTKEPNSSTLSFGVHSRVSRSPDLEFSPGAFPDPFEADNASRVSIDTEALEPYDAPELPEPSSKPRSNSKVTDAPLPFRPSNSSERGSAHRSSSDASSWSGSGGSWPGGRHPVEALSEKEIAKLRKKGINPELFAEMREARRKAHGKRARLVGPLVGSTFVG
ncbi:MAG: hypothetical protein Q9165_000760 [Trypethelium subeluteriae]